MLQPNNLAAAVVCYFPDMTGLMQLLQVLTRTCNMVVLVNNGGLDGHAAQLQAFSGKIRVVTPGANVGMASALNLSFTMAEDAGLSHLISFDQDSDPGVDTLDILINDFNALERDGMKIAAIGPRFYDPRNMPLEDGGGREMSGASGQEREVHSYIITSGCLASIAAWRDSGGFDEKLFIDLVDIEWCWRLGAEKYQVCVSKDALMAHRLSKGMKVFLGKFRFNTYDPIRRFYIARNALYLLLHKRWTRAQTVFLMKSFIFSAASAIVSDEKKIRSIKSIVIGCTHAIRGRMGKYGEEGK